MMPQNVAHFLSEQASLNPDNPAVRAADGRESDGSIRYVERTFCQLESEASATAHLFAESGIGRGTRVLLMVKPGLDLIRIVFALFKIGAVPIVIDPGMGLKIPSMRAPFKAGGAGGDPGCDMGLPLVLAEF